MKKLTVCILYLVVVLAAFAGCVEEEDPYKVIVPERAVDKRSMNTNDPWVMELLSDNQVVYTAMVQPVVWSSVIWKALDRCGASQGWCVEGRDGHLVDLFRMPIAGHYRGPGQGLYNCISPTFGEELSEPRCDWMDKRLFVFEEGGASMTTKLPLYDLLCDGSSWNEASVEIVSLRTQFYPERVSSIVIDGVFYCATTSVEMQVHFKRLEEDER